MSTRVDEFRTPSQAGRVVDQLVKRKREANPAMGYGDALVLVAKENAGLFRRVNALQLTDRFGTQLVAAYTVAEEPTALEKALDKLKALSEEWNHLLSEEMEKGKNYSQAADAVRKANPGLEDLLGSARDLVRNLKAAAVGLGELTGEQVSASDVHTAGEAEFLVLRLVEQKRKLQPTISYGMALKLVASENPALFRKREMLQRRVW